MQKHYKLTICLLACLLGAGLEAAEAPKVPDVQSVQIPTAGNRAIELDNALWILYLELQKRAEVLADMPLVWNVGGEGVKTFGYENRQMRIDFFVKLLIRLAFEAALGLGREVSSISNEEIHQRLYRHLNYLVGRECRLSMPFE